MLAGGGCLPPVFRMQMSGGRHYHAVDGGIGQHRVVIAARRQVVFRAEICDAGRIAADRRGEPDGFAGCLYRFDEIPAPAAEPDNGQIEHGVSLN